MQYTEDFKKIMKLGLEKDAKIYVEITGRKECVAICFYHNNTSHLGASDWKTTPLHSLDSVFWK